MTLKHAKTSAAGASSDPTKVGGDDWNADHVIDVNGLNLPANSSKPSNPASGQTLFAQTFGGSSFAATLGTAGVPLLLQPLLGRAAATIWVMTQGSATPLAWGNLNSTSNTALIGTVVFNQNLYLALPRCGSQSSTTAGSIARTATGAPECMRSTNTTQFGGFRTLGRFGCQDGLAGMRSFVGLNYSSTPTGDPSAFLGCVGVGTDAGDTNLSIFTNDFSGAATKIPLGANFPAHTASTDVYDLWMYCPRDGSYITVTVTRLNTGDTYTTQLTTDLPPSGTGLYYIFQRANSPTVTGSSRIDIFGLYCDKEY